LRDDRSVDEGSVNIDPADDPTEAVGPEVTETSPSQLDIVEAMIGQAEANETATQPRATETSEANEATSHQIEEMNNSVNDPQKKM